MTAMMSGAARHLGLALLVGCFALAQAGQAQAGTITVNATDDIYYVDQPSDPNGGTVPAGAITLGGATSVLFTSVTGSLTCGASSSGCITLDNNHLNDADGTGAVPATSSNTGANGISGITGPGAGYLVGVFLAAGGPSGPAPTALDFTTGSGTSFSSLSPLLDQSFFIGDGLTGDGTGSTQTFNIPAGATTLVLGISDACNYNGSPGCLNDNAGTFTVTDNLQGTPTGVPEPATMALLGTGLIGLAAGRRRRRR